MHQFSSDSFSPHRFLSRCRFHRWHQIACVCVRLCLTCRTSAQTAVSMARAASCHRKAGASCAEGAVTVQLACVGYFSAPSRRVHPYVHVQ